MSRVLALCLLCACGGHRPAYLFYVDFWGDYRSGDHQLPKPSKLPEVRRATPDGDVVVEDLESLDPRERTALDLFSSHRTRGWESDIWIDDSPVNIWRTVDGDVTIALGDAGLLPSEPWTTTAADIEDGYGVIVGDGFSPEELASLGLALERTREDLGSIEGARLVRDHRVHGRLRARATSAPREVTFFEPGRNVRGGWIGSIEQPYTSFVATAVHEIGHLVDGHFDSEIVRRTEELRVRVAEADPDALEQANALLELQACVYARRPSAVLWKDIGRFRPPTLYRPSEREQFADAYMLYRLDPEALRRVEPDILDWFEGGGVQRNMAEIRERCFSGPSELAMAPG